MSLSKNRSACTESSSSNRKLLSTSELRTKISKIFNEEYEENFNQILILSQENFFSIVNTRVDLVLNDSYSDLLRDESPRIISILKTLENEKKIEYKKEFNFLDQQLKLFFKENIGKINLETHEPDKLEKSKLNKKSLQYKPIKKEKESLSSNDPLNDMFEFLAKNDDKRNFYFRKHCIFNKNHALHACFEEQIEKLNKLKSTSNSVSIKDLNLENTNFFLSLFESGFKNHINRSSLDEAKGIKTSKNSISLTTSYSNFINNVRKSNGVFIDDKYKNLKKLFNKEKDTNKDYIKTNDKIKYLICLLCKKVYKSESILLHCDFCSLPFYTYLNENKEESIYPATWEKYHCGAIVNDQMRCMKCKAYLNLDSKTNKLICSQCNFISDPSKIIWNCLLCDKEFKSNAKIYNPLEFKLVKLAIKDAILNKIPVFPEEIDCCMEIREKIIKSGLKSWADKPDDKFYLNHKRECPGLLYEGFLYNRKVVVCSECKAFVNYDKFIWFCPFCNKRYRKKNTNFDGYEIAKNEEKDDLSALNNNYKSEINFEKDIKTNLGRDLTITSNISNKNTHNLIEDIDKNNELENSKSRNNLEKEEFNLPCRSSNISKVININMNNNDKAILDRIKSKFTNSNFSSNFDSFISKAVNSKRSPLIKEALNRSINLNFSVNDIEELKRKKNNALNFSMVNYASSDLEKNKSDDSEKKNYFISSNNSNTNNNSSRVSTFKNINKNNNKLKIISLKGMKFNNQSNIVETQISALEKDNKINNVGKGDEIIYRHSSFNDNTKSTVTQETYRSKFNNQNNDLYEIIKEDNPKLNDLEFENKIEKEDLLWEYRNKKTKREDQMYNKRMASINLDESPIENENKKFTITPSIKNSKLHFNSFFKNNESKNDDNESNQSINQDEQNQDPNLNGLIYNRNSLILKKNSNNKNENYVTNISSVPDLFKKENIKRVNNRIYIKSMKFDRNIRYKNVSCNEKAESPEKNLDISNHIYIPAKQRMHLNSDQISNPDNCWNEKDEQKEKFENSQLEIMYKTEDKNEMIINSSLNARSERKTSNENDKIGTILSNKINIYSSVNSNNNLNDLSTSSISHNNKFINCYLSKKSSENEMFNNLNYSSNKMNYENNTNYKNSNDIDSTFSNRQSKKNILRHQSMIFSTTKKLFSDRDCLNIANKAKNNLIQNLEEYFSQNRSDLNYENNTKNYQENIGVFNNNSRKKSNSFQNFVYVKNKSMSLNQCGFTRTLENMAMDQNNSKNNNLIENMNENVESDFSLSSGIVSSSLTLSNINNYNVNKDSKNNIYRYAKKNSINSNISLNCSSNNTNLNNNLFVNKEGSVIKEIIDEDLLELEYSCSKSRLRKSLNFNTNSKQNSSLQKENVNENNEFAFNSPYKPEMIKESRESKKEEQIEIIFCKEENEKLSKQSNIYEKLRKIKIENKDEELNLQLRSYDNHEEKEASFKKPNLRTNFKAKPENNLEIYPSNYEIFDFSNFTYKKDNLEFIECNSNKGNSDRRRSNKKVNFLESEDVFSNLSSNKLELKYEIINYNSPFLTKKADFNKDSVKNSIKSSSQISIVNTSQNNNFMVDENNINFLIEDFTFNLDDYLIEKSIGEGSYATVFAASNIFNFTKYAIKKIIVDDISHINNLVSEIRILSKFNHENVIQIYGMFFKKLDETTFALYILMELASMDWESQIKNMQVNKILYSEMELVEMLKQITSCLSFLQQNNISHRDIKPNNILIFGNIKSNSSKKNCLNSSLIKVSDFGEARITQGNHTNNLYTIKGTELFMSPKLTECYQNIEKQVNHNPYKSDCFSLGLCLLYAASLNINSVFDIRKEIQEKGSISATINKYLKLKFTKKFIDLLMKMLNIDETKRFDFNELNEFLKKF